MKKALPKFIILLIAFILSSLSIILFYKSGLGINFPIFNLILTIVLIVVGFIFKRLNTSLILNSMLIFLISVPLSLTTAIPIRVVLFLTWLYFSFLTIQTIVQPNEKFEFWKYVTVPIEQFVMSFISPFLIIGKQKIRKLAPSTVFLRILLGTFIAIPILIVFILLLVSADLAFRNLLNNLFEISFLADVIKIVIWFVIAFWFSIGTLYYNLVKKQKYQIKEANKDKKSSRFFIESVTILVLTEVLFLAFNIIQIAYFFGGERMISSGDFTYSEYARKGFFELVAVSVLSLGLIALLFKIKKVSSNIQDMIIRIIGISGIMLLVPMTISAFYRLYMYESEYGFTRLRVYSHLFIIFLIILFAWFIVKFSTKIKEKIFLYGIELITIISLFIVGVINVDAVITQINIDKYLNSESVKAEIDLAYLHTLSHDSVPTFIEFFNNSKGEIKQEAAFYLKAKYDMIKFETRKRDYREYNIRQEITLNLLEENIEEIKKYSQMYEEDITNEYKDSDRSISYLEFNNSNCLGKEKIVYINKDAYQEYYNSIDIYKLDNSNYIIEEVNQYGCYNFEDGDYFIVIKGFNDFPWESARDVFLLELDKDIDDDLVLITRDNSYYIYD
jgi:hypothetical protein